MVMTNKTDLGRGLMAAQLISDHAFAVDMSVRLSVTLLSHT